MLLALLVHVVVVGGPILASLYYVETINLKEFTTTPLVTAASSATASSTCGRRHQGANVEARIRSLGKLLAPTHIPKQ